MWKGSWQKGGNDWFIGNHYSWFTYIPSKIFARPQYIDRNILINYLSIQNIVGEKDLEVHFWLFIAWLKCEWRIVCQCVSDVPFFMLSIVDSLLNKEIISCSIHLEHILSVSKVVGNSHTVSAFIACNMQCYPTGLKLIGV